MVKSKRTTPSKIRKPDEEPPLEKSITKPDEPEEDNSYENMVYGRLNIGCKESRRPRDKQTGIDGLYRAPRSLFRRGYSEIAGESFR